MRRREHIHAAVSAAWLDAFAWCAVGNGRDSLLGIPSPFADEAASRAGWTACRRAVWARTTRFRIPRAAEHYDGLRTDGLDELRRTWNHNVFPLADVLAATEGDRARLATFRPTPAGETIADYLDMLGRDFDAVAATAHALEAAPDVMKRKHPAHLNTARTYGQVGDDPPTARIDDTGEDAYADE